MVMIDIENLELIERLAVKGLQLDLRLKRKTEVPTGTIQLLEELTKKSGGVLTEHSRLSVGRYLWIHFNKMSIIQVDKKGNSKTINKFSLGVVAPMFRTELFIKLSGDTKPGLIEAEQTGTSFQLDKEQISLSAGLRIPLMEKKSEIVRMLKS